MKERLWQAMRMGASWMLRRYANTTLETLQLEGARFYIRGVDKLRLACQGILVGLLVLGFGLAALVLLPLGVILCLMGATNLSLLGAGVILLLFVAFYALVAIYVAVMLLNERAWMRFFHVDDVLLRLRNR